jgi:alpha-glucosidase
MEVFMTENAKFLWWQTGVVYQIYPRSYMDSNGDGIGDLPGITLRLDYLKGLGVEAIWLSPIYPSPMHDFGYDVADYCDINPLFGNMADFDLLLAETHKRGLKLILDLVPNHTSDEHRWFLESRSSRDNPKRDWYIWRNPAPDGGAPNNWLSYFGGSAWQFDEKTGQYYLHLFVKQQPDLNYRNPEVVAALLNTMHFWLDKGVDGFRVDVIGLMMKDPDFRDEPLDPAWDGVDPHKRFQHIRTENLPEVHGLIQQMREVLDSYNERMMVGETYVPNETLMKYYGTPEKREIHLPFNFQLILAKWEAAKVRKMVDDYEAILPADAWPNWVLGNHDQHRLSTRIGAHQARVANMLLLTAAPRLATMAMKLACRMCRSRRTWCRTRPPSTCRKSPTSLAVTRNAPRCNGTPHPTLVFPGRTPPKNPGCRWRRTIPKSMWSGKPRIRARSWPFTRNCWPIAKRHRP